MNPLPLPDPEAPAPAARPHPGSTAHLVAGHLPEDWERLDRLNHDLERVRAALDDCRLDGYAFRAVEVGGVAAVQVGAIGPGSPDAVEWGRPWMLWHSFAAGEVAGVAYRTAKSMSGRRVAKKFTFRGQAIFRDGECT